MPQVPSPPASGATPPVIVGNSAPKMKPAVKTPLVRLNCNPAFSHMFGEASQCSAGQYHVASDGVVLEPPHIAVALLEVIVPIEDKPTPIFTLDSDEDEKILKAYLTSQLGAAAEGEDVGRLVYIQCETMANESTTAEGVKITFDSSGRAVVGERIYQKIRPAFGGDGAIPEKENPAHLLRFLGYVSPATEDEDLEDGLESGEDGDENDSDEGDFDENDTAPNPDTELQLGVETEDTDLSQSPEQLSKAAQALNDFNAAPPTPLHAATSEPAKSESVVSAPPPAASEPTATKAASTETASTETASTETTATKAPARSRSRSGQKTAATTAATTTPAAPAPGTPTS